MPALNFYLDLRFGHNNENEKLARKAGNVASCLAKQGRSSFSYFMLFSVCFTVMGRVHKRKLGSRRYADYTKETLQAAVQAVRRGMSSRAAEERFGIPRRTILNKVKNRHLGKIGRPNALSEVEERHLVILTQNTSFVFIYIKKNLDDCRLVSRF